MPHGQGCGRLPATGVAIGTLRPAASGTHGVVLKLKSPYRDGTRHIVVEPLEFMQRLAALVPRPRLNLIRFHGVLASNHKLRAEVVSKQASTVTPSSADDEQPEVAGINADWRISWARLLKRVFNIDIETCFHCQGKLRIVAAITTPAVGYLLEFCRATGESAI